MTLDQLQAFVAVAILRHFTRAADQLGRSQPAVSAAIAALEQRYGVRLFDRSGRSVALTEAGHLLLVQAQRILRAVGEAEQTLLDLNTLSIGHLRLFASQTVGTYWLPAPALAFRQRYPGIRVEIALGNTEDVLAVLAAGDADLGFIEAPVDPAGRVIRPLVDDALVVAVGPGHRWWQRQTPVDLAELSDTAWVLREPGSGTRRLFEAVLAERGIEIARLDILLALPSNEAAILAVAAGVAATMVSERAAADAAAAGRICIVPGLRVARRFSVLHPADRPLPRAAEAFLHGLDSFVTK